MQRKYISQSQKLPKPEPAINRMQKNLFDKLSDVFQAGDIKQHDEDFNVLNNNTQQVDILSKAKYIVHEKQQENPKFFDEGREKILKEQIKESNKKGTFMITAVNIVKPKPKVQVVKKQQVSQEYEEERNEVDMLKDLIYEENKPYDDLAELRIMIAKTKKNMDNYAYGLYNLKGNVQEANTHLRPMGYGVSDQVFDEMDRGFYKYNCGDQQRPKSRERGIKKSTSTTHGLKLKKYN